MNVILCCDSQEAGNEVTGQLNRICAAKVISCYTISDFLSQINDSSDAIMMIVKSGALGAETAMLARERNPKGKLVWFSDFDFALISFRLKTSYFGLIPIEDSKMKIALGYCGIPLKIEKRMSG